MIIDSIALILIFILAIRGGIRGLLEEFSSKLGIMVGVLAAVMFTGPVVSMIPLPEMGKALTVAVFIALAIVGYILMKVFLKIMKEVFNALHLAPMDHILGGCFGALEGILITIAILYLLRFQNIFSTTEIFPDSKAVELLTPSLLFLLKFSWKDQI